MKHIYRYTLSCYMLILLCISLIPGVQAQSITAGLVGHWTFDNGTLADSSGNGFSGTLRGTATPLTTICGVKGDAVQFPGDGTMVEFNNGINTYFSTADITVSFWFRIPEGSTNKTLVSKRRNNTGSCCYVGGSFDTRSNANGVYTEVAGWPGPGQANPPTTNYNALSARLPHGCWYHYTFTRSGRNLSIYVNGELSRTVTSANSIHDYTNPNSVLGIGNGECFTRGCGDQSFNGSIDELRVYNRALTADEVSMLYRDPLPHISFLATDTTICSDRLQLVAENYSCGVSVAWEPAAIMDIPTSFSPVAGFVLPSQTEVVATFTDQWGCILTQDTVNVQAFPTPLAEILADTIDCVTLALKAAAPPAGAPGLQYEWWLGDGTTGSGDSVTHVYATGGAYTVVLRVTGQGGCFAYDTLIAVLDKDMPLSLGPDTTICLHDTLILSAGQPQGMRYLWSTGISDSTIRVISGGVYWLEAGRNGCKRSDTILVSIIPRPGVLLGEDTTICEAVPLRIGSTFPTADYLWSTGSTDPYIHVNATGSYWLRVSAATCATHDTINITAIPPPGIDLGKDRDICDKQTIVLDATWAGSRYRWNTGDTTATLAATAAGFYQVEVTDAYSCVATDSVTLHYYPYPEIFAGPDTVVCEETPLIIKPWHINTDSLLWSDGSTGRYLTVKDGGAYIVSAINKCGIKADTISIRQMYCDIMIPGAFSPNGDGLNDILRVLGNTAKLEGFRFSIYNRWGGQIFYTEDKRKGWDGYYKGVPAQIGTYVYMLEYSILGKPYMLKGDVHLIR